MEMLTARIDTIHPPSAPGASYHLNLSLKNDGDTPLVLNGAISLLPALQGRTIEAGKSVIAQTGPIAVGGQVVDRESGVTPFSLAPGESWQSVLPLKLPSACLVMSDGSSIPLGLEIECWTGESEDTLSRSQMHLTVEVPVIAVSTWLQTDYGTRSAFYIDNGQVFFSAYWCSDTRLGGLASEGVRALTEDLLLAGPKIINPEVSKRAPKGNPRGLSGVFYGTDDEVWTLNGPAKIADPQTFTVLDHGEEVDLGHRVGFARDAKHVYFFDSLSDTRHAVRLRGCKDPGAFRLLNQGYATDGTAVFWTWLKLKGADTETFEPVSYNYARDKNGIWFMAELKSDIDPETFTLIQNPGETPGFHRDASDVSGWAKDSQGWIYCGDRTEAIPIVT